MLPLITFSIDECSQLSFSEKIHQNFHNDGLRSHEATKKYLHKCLTFMAFIRLWTFVKWQKLLTYIQFARVENVLSVVYLHSSSHTQLIVEASFFVRIFLLAFSYIEFKIERKKLPKTFRNASLIFAKRPSFHRSRYRLLFVYQKQDYFGVGERLRGKVKFLNRTFRCVLKLCSKETEYYTYVKMFSLQFRYEYWLRFAEYL